MNHITVSFEWYNSLPGMPLPVLPLLIGPAYGRFMQDDAGVFRAIADK